MIDLYPVAGHRWLVEAQIEILAPIFVESIVLEPPEACTASAAAAPPLPVQRSVKPAIPETTPSRWPEHLPRFERSPTGYLGAGAQIRRVFEVVLKPKLVPPGSMGKLTISWRGAFGEAAKFSAILTRTQDARMSVGAALSDAIDLRILGISHPDPGTAVPSSPSSPTSVVLHKTFVLRCSVMNRTQATISAKIAFVEDGSRIQAVLPPDEQPPQQQQQQQPAPTGIAVVGSSGDPHPIDLLPSKDHEVSFTLLPIQPGIRKLGGISVIESRTSREHYFSDIGSVFVISN